MSNADQSIVDKIAKILELTKSPNENEAAGAARAAQKLMLKYDLELSDISSTEEVQVVKEHLIYGQIKDMWLAVLIHNCARAYLCRILKKGHDEILIVGKPHHVKICKSMYYYLERAMEANLALTKKTNKVNPQSFKEGWAIAVSNRLKELINQTDNDEKTNALIVVEDTQVDAYMKKNSVPGMATKLQYAKLEYNSYFLGKENGSKVPLNTQLA